MDLMVAVSHLLPRSSYMLRMLTQHRPSDGLRSMCYYDSDVPLIRVFESLRSLDAIYQQHSQMMLKVPKVVNGA